MSVLSESYKMSRTERQTGCIADFAAFSQPPTSNLFAWFTATEAYDNVVPASGTIITADGTAVDSLKDLSGNGYHISQATAGNRPTFQTNEINSTLPVIRFDGSNDELGKSSLSQAQPLSMYLVYKPVAWGAGTRDVVAFDTTGAGVRYQRSSSVMNIVSGTTANAGGDDATGSFYLIAGVFNNTSSLLQQGTGTLYTGGSGTGTLTKIFVGSGDAQQWSQIDFAELLIYTEAQTFSSGGGLAARQYLNSKYNLGLSL